ncbi:MAG TPA: calcium/sodium antiporter [Candidatus Hydrogenedentes bacterium]|nr:calcium/sodium antiporter [Candidatus Hydrogenedentota bacterium]HPJ98638.1 calcium/sodium antiporter [Candidatus Hydrogenedentota bacterium]
MQVALYILGMGLGVLLLAKSADWFTDAAVSIACRLNVPEILIGATLVSLATTLPEFAVSVAAALKQQTDVAVGNAVGSTIANIGLVLGLCIVLSPMGVARRGFLRSSLGLVFVCLIFACIGYLFPEGSRWTGVVMLLCLAAYLAANIRSAMPDPKPGTSRIPTAGESSRDALLGELASETSVDGAQRVELATGLTAGRVAAYFLLGAVGVIAGSKLVVYCAEHLALAAGISRHVIALTLVALGTSTPELVISLAAIIKKQRGLSIGNIIGANILNLVWVLGASSLITVIPLDAQSLYFDIPVMLFLTGLLFVFGFTGERLSRWEGFVLLSVYAAYLVVLFTVYRVPAVA